MERQKGPWSCWVGLPRPMYHSIIQESDRHTYQHAHIPYQFGAVHKVRHAIFGQFYPLPLSHFVTHPGTTPPKVRHTSRTPRYLEDLVQKLGQKHPCTNSVSIVHGGFYQGVFCLEGYVRGGFCPFPFCQNRRRRRICYNRKLNITLNFMFRMYDKKIYKCDVTCSLPPPLSQTVTPSRTPSPSSVTYFMDGPFVGIA